MHNVCHLGSNNGTVRQIYGYATLGEGADTAKLTVYFYGRGAPYWVIYIGETADGEYEHALAWSCKHVLLDIDFLWVLSRQPTVPEATYAGLLEKAKSITGYDAPAKVKKTTQDANCPK